MNNFSFPFLLSPSILSANVASCFQWWVHFPDNCPFRRCLSVAMLAGSYALEPRRADLTDLINFGYPKFSERLSNFSFFFLPGPHIDPPLSLHVCFPFRPCFPAPPFLHVALFSLFFITILSVSLFLFSILFAWSFPDLLFSCSTCLHFSTFDSLVLHCTPILICFSLFLFCLPEECNKRHDM